MFNNSLLQYHRHTQLKLLTHCDPTRTSFGLFMCLVCNTMCRYIVNVAPTTNHNLRLAHRSYFMNAPTTSHERTLIVPRVSLYKLAFIQMDEHARMRSDIVMITFGLSVLICSPSALYSTIHNCNAGAVFSRQCMYYIVWMFMYA